MPHSTAAIAQVARPHGAPRHSDFATVSWELDEVGPGMIKVRNTVLSVDPYMRGQMTGHDSYIPAFRLDEPMTGGAIGEVVESEDPATPVGAIVRHDLGWRELAVLRPGQFTVVDTDLAPASAYLGILGMTGLTAYVGLTRMAALVSGDSLFVSGAAGAVGSAAGQIGRALGASRVVGSAGSEAKIKHLVGDLGFDEAFDYHKGPVVGLIGAAMPEGIDVFFDNVGGDHLQGALTHTRNFARIVTCGAISSYDSTEAPAGPDNLDLAIVRRLTIRGFIVYDHGDLEAEYVSKAACWITDGTLRYEETWSEGLDHAVDAFLGLGQGRNLGKMLVRLP
jgi:NADPH-dependent curcumin reductase CurA